ncbi:hypothetical protein COCSADRAFT_40554 [Bipolaris sorokiniana ND90Pr]|uniref:Uncharacterized protein n=1 Tax=Cochliobolus sativus (strain ND90Pr / ATCC 201652) TaxID=665912 RepID=M2SST2_COCSN|nr:uncharacterized protein COCSADRAFT_40554 [Bipolaris sorokiniana ND90Pr]EMD60121.1 hypothetical protein COCSADRAFT_40554 [Bipolaris sorokiniana ND90Pr]
MALPPPLSVAVRLWLFFLLAAIMSSYVNPLGQTTHRLPLPAHLLLWQPCHRRRLLEALCFSRILPDVV